MIVNNHAPNSILVDRNQNIDVVNKITGNLALDDIIQLSMVSKKMNEHLFDNSSAYRLVKSISNAKRLFCESNVEFDRKLIDLIPKLSLLCSTGGTVPLGFARLCSPSNWNLRIMGEYHTSDLDKSAEEMKLLAESVMKKGDNGDQILSAHDKHREELFKTLTLRKVGIANLKDDLSDRKKFGKCKEMTKLEIEQAAYFEKYLTAVSNAVKHHLTPQ